VILRIRLVKERELIGGVLVKNGYRVKQIKLPKPEGKRGDDICLSFNASEIFVVRNPVDREIIAGKLIKNGYEVECVSVAVGKSFVKGLKVTEPDEFVPSYERVDME
jgi:hypothetical protein